MNGKGDAEVGDVSGNNVPVSHAANENTGTLRRTRFASILIRLASAPLCIIALVLMVTDKQVHVFTLPLTPPVYFSKVAKYNGIKAFEFYVYANGIVAGYMLLHALYSILTFLKAGSGGNRFRLWLTFFLDQLMVYLLLAAAAATTEVAYIAEKGDSRAGWEQTCSLFGKFCNKVGASIFVCFCGILGLVVLAALSAHQLFSSTAHRQSTGKMATTIAAPKNAGRI